MEDADKEADEADGGPLCLDQAGCREACDLLAGGCAYYSMHVSG